MDNCIKVKRAGPRGWHWIAADSFDPKVHELAERIAPFDHDGDGKPGGSLKGAESTVAKGRKKKAADE